MSALSPVCFLSLSRSPYSNAAVYYISITAERSLSLSLSLFPLPLYSERRRREDREDDGERHTSFGNAVTHLLLPLHFVKRSPALRHCARLRLTLTRATVFSLYIGCAGLVERGKRGGRRLPTPVSPLLLTCCASAPLSLSLSPSSSPSLSFSLLLLLRPLNSYLSSVSLTSLPRTYPFPPSPPSPPSLPSPPPPPKLIGRRSRSFSPPTPRPVHRL